MNEGNLLYAFSVLKNIDELQSPATLATIVERLNQWSTQAPDNVEWSLDPLVETLPAECRQLTVVRQLAEPRFLASDGRELQQTMWLGEIAKRARGEDNTPLIAAQELFDWVVRNIQLERDGSIEIPHMPRELLLFGRGTAVDRAWLFSLLARQQGLDVVALALPAKDGAEQPRFWLTALAFDDELYLFDPRLGLPIPGPGGKGVATLKQVLADEALLRQLDVDDERRYPIAHADLEKIVVPRRRFTALFGPPDEPGRKRPAGQRGFGPLRASLGDRRTNEDAAPHRERADLAAAIRAHDSLQDGAMRKKADEEFIPFLQPSVVLWQARTLHLLGSFEGEERARRHFISSRAEPTKIWTQISKTLRSRIARASITSSRC